MDKHTLPPRIPALDLLRGYFLCVIIIDHLFRFPNIFEFITGRGQLWVSAAEGFFIISGILVGYLYAYKVRSDFRFVLSKIWQRALKLWFISVILTLLFTVWGHFLPESVIKSGLWTGGGPVKLLVAALTFRYSYGWADFLPYYAVFMFFAPFILWLAGKLGSLPVVFISLLIWLFRGSDFYLAWQLLFVLGLIAGTHLMQLESAFAGLSLIFRSRISSVLLILSLLTAGLSVFFVFVRNSSPAFFDKDTLGPGRLMLSLLWFITAYILVRSREKVINSISGGKLGILGKNSLFVYILHSWVLFPINLLLPYTGSWLLNSLISLGVLAVIYLGASRYRTLLHRIRDYLSETVMDLKTPYLFRLPQFLLLTLISRLL